mmetsp:Transcript_24594/g.29019  ORF Transcript_24594/g.29019 Transcript_24594/m.29019 type:complete len:531 (+) Transcript_24594:135-1727(+)
MGNNNAVTDDLFTDDAGSIIRQNHNTNLTREDEEEEEHQMPHEHGNRVDANTAPVSTNTRPTSSSPNGHTNDTATPQYQPHIRLLHDHVTQSESSAPSKQHRVHYVSRPTSPDTLSSCMSDLSDDESHFYFSDLPSVVKNSPPVHPMNSDSYQHQHSHNQLEAERPVEYNLGGNIAVHEDESPTQRSPFRRGDSIPHQLTFNSSKIPRTVSTESTLERGNHLRVSIHNVEDLDNEDQVAPRHSKLHSQGNGGRPLDTNIPYPYHHRTVSTTMKRTQGQPRTRRHYRGNSFSSKNSTVNTYTPGTNNSYRRKKNMSRHSSFSHLPVRTHDPPALLRKSKSIVSMTNTSMSLSQYGSYNRNSHHSFAHGLSIDGGSNSITSASYDSIHQSSIVVNGRVVNNIKHRRRYSDTVSLGRSGDIGDNERNLPIVGNNSSTLYKAAAMEKLAELEPSISNESTLMNTPSLLDSSKVSLNDSQENLGKENRRKKRRRSVKDELRYLVGKIVPSPLKGMRTVLTRKKSCDLERSSGCLT